MKQSASYKIFSIFYFLLFICKSSFAIGHIDSITFNGSNLQINGWACKNSDPDALVQLTIQLGTSEQFSATASLPREPAVATACNSNHSNHGFNLNLTPTLDNIYKEVVILVHESEAARSVLTHPNNKFFFKSPDLITPSYAADIVARNLDVPALGQLGHLGLYNIDGTVWEVLNVNNNVVQHNSWNNFITHTKVWNTAVGKVPSSGTIKTCFNPVSCLVNSGPVFGGSSAATYPLIDIPSNVNTLDRREAALWRAYQIYASPSVRYTLSRSYTPAVPAIKDATTNAVIKNAIHGIYRCDTYVLDALAITIRPNSNNNNSIWSNHTLPYEIITTFHQGWASSYSNFSTLGTPQSIHNAIFQLNSY